MARVLVVDDSPAVLKVLVDGLAARGHDVVAASDGLQAREILDSHEVGVLITDLQLPRLHGLALLAHVRTAEHPIPVIMLSGSWSPQHQEWARVLGAARVYVKPVALDQLARDVEELAR